MHIPPPSVVKNETDGQSEITWCISQSEKYIILQISDEPGITCTVRHAGLKSVPYNITFIELQIDTGNTFKREGKNIFSAKL